jgi:hypothetical protein
MVDGDAPHIGGVRDAVPCANKLAAMRVIERYVRITPN